MEPSDSKVSVESGIRARVLTVASGTVLAHVITMAASPLLTRLYSPSDFGAFQIFVAASTVVGSILALRFEVAIPLAGSDRSAFDLLALALGLLFVGAANLTFVVLLVWVLFRGASQRVQDFGPVLLLMPLGAFNFGLAQILNYWAARSDEYKSLASSRVVQTSVQAVSQTAVAGLRALGLVAGDVFGRLCGSVYLLRRFSSDVEYAIRSASRSSIRKCASEFRRFPLLTAPSALVSVSGLNAPILLIPALYSAEVAGWFALSNRIASVPLVLLGQAMAPVFYGEGAKLARSDLLGFHRLYRSTVRRLALAGAIPILLGSWFAPSVFSLVFGDAWTEAGTILRVLGALYFVQFVSSPLSQTLLIVDRQDWLLYWDLLRLAGVIASILVPAVAFDQGYLVTILSYSLFMAAMFLAMIGLNDRAIRSAVEADA